MPDLHKNFAYSTVATAPSTPTAGTSLVVSTGGGANFPAVPFNATIWPTGALPTAANAEIVRVTARSTDTLTIVRAQESSSARTVVIGDQIAATITNKTLTDSEQMYPNAANANFVESGLVITPDSVGVNKNYSITSGVVWIAGVRLTVAAVSAQTVGASKDRYVDLTNNGDGTAIYVTNEVANNAASQALTAGNLRIGIVVAGTTTIATSGSINQGQESMVLPIASSVAYSVVDSIGNLICPRDPNSKIIGYRQNIVGFTTASSSVVQITGLSVPCIVPTGRKVKVSVWTGECFNTTATARADLEAWDGTVGSGTRLAQAYGVGNSGFSAGQTEAKAITTPATSSKTYNGGLFAENGGTATIQAAATTPVYIMVELE